MKKLGLNNGTPYANCPVGNSPEIMPLDFSLNKNIHEGVRRHCVYTSRLERDDNKKISLNTTKQGVHAYRKLWDPKHLPEGIPSGEYIMQDINLIINENMMRIIKARSAVVPGLGTRRGQRRDLGLKPLLQGGRMVKNYAFQEKWTHVDAVQSKKNLIRNAVSRKKKFFPI